MGLALLLLLQDPAIEQYLAEKDKSARAKVLSEIKLPIAEVEAELRKPPRRPAAAGGERVRRKLKADHPLAVEFEYVLWVPRDYTPDRRRRLLVSLHGSGSNGEAHGKFWINDLQKAGDTFLLCPSAGRGGWGRSLLGHAYVLTSLRDVLAGYAIDPDLVFLDGVSMGGNGSFDFACEYPDLFAGAAPRSGGPRFRYVQTGATKNDRTVVAELLENLLPLPLYWVVGGKDPEVPNAWVQIAKAQLETLKADFILREYPEGGHQWFSEENPKVIEWMDGKRRSAYPPRVAVTTSERIFNRSYWLEISEFRGKEIIKRGFIDADGKNIEDRLIFQDPIQARGEIVRDSNEIKVSTTGVREVRVYLHERMVDFGKPVTVTVNGSKSTFQVKPSLETLLESARRDRGLLYTASVRVKVP